MKDDGLQSVRDLLEETSSRLHCGEVMHIIRAVYMTVYMYKGKRASKLTRSVEMYVSVDNMSKSCCFAFVLAVICLSLEADAQPTVDETMTCGSSTSDDVLNIVKMIATNQQENTKDVKKLLASNPTDSVTADPSKQALV